LATKKAHHKKWKLIKQQSGRAAGSGRQGADALPVAKKRFSWLFVGEVTGDGLAIKDVWNKTEAAKHFSAGYTSGRTTPTPAAAMFPLSR